MAHTDSGGVWRPLTAQDAPAIRRLREACALVDGDAFLPGDSVLRRIERGGEDLRTDSWALVAPSGEVVAYAVVELDASLVHELRAVVEGCVRPDSRRLGHGEQLLRWAESRSKAVWNELADSRPLVSRVDTIRPTPETIAFLEHRGYRLTVAEQEMRRGLDSIPEIPLPSGLSVESWSDATAGAFYCAYQDAFRQRPHFPDWSEEVWRQAYTGYPEFRPDFSVVVLHGLEPVGYAVCAAENIQPEGLVGQIVQLGVGPAWRRRGVAGAIISTVLRLFAQNGARTATLDVSMDNPEARALYERMEFREGRAYRGYRKTLLKSTPG